MCWQMEAWTPGYFKTGWGTVTSDTRVGTLEPLQAVLKEFGNDWGNCQHTGIYLEIKGWALDVGTSP